MKRRRFLRRRLLYSANGTASFNPSLLENNLSGDIHPHPGPNSTSNSSSTSTNTNISFPCNTKSNIRIAHLNIRSLKSREHFTLLKDSVVSNNFDIFTISETWLDSSVNNESIHIPGYTLYRQDRGPHKPGGGLCVYIKKNYKVSSLENVSSVSDNNFQQLWLKVQSRCYKSFVICTVYRPPSTPLNFIDDLANSLIESLLSGLDVIILGDLNCNLLQDNAESRALNDFCSTFNLTQLINKPTRATENGESLIDVVMTTNEKLIASNDVLMSTISDHNLVYISLKLKKPRIKPCYVTIRSYTNYSADNFLRDLSYAPFHIISLFDDFNDQVDVFNELFLEVLSQHAPVKRVKIRSKPNPFITPEIRQLMRTRDQWRKLAGKTNDPFHWNGYRFFRQEVKREIRVAEKVHVRTQILDSNGNSNSIWKIINRCLPRKQQDSFMASEDPTGLANELNDFFTSVGSITAQKARDLSLHHGLNVNLDVPTPLHISTDVSPELFVLHQVTENQVERVIRSLPSNKAPGMDKISSRILKDSLPSTLTTITHIVNNSFVTNTFARAWKTAEVTPILKCGNPDVPNNYRPISLLPIVSKVTERLVHGQLMEHLIRNNKLAAHQSGNRKLHSTETALLYVTDQLLQAMDNKKVSIMVLLDMSKAFDSIRHDILLSKLQNLDFSQGALDWFQSYLSNRQQCVRIGDAVSKVLPLEFGVPQGSILGPVLFTIYVNDLLSVPKRCLSASYVDDCKLYLSFSPAEFPTSILALNEDLTRISQWCCKNSPLINPDKTKVLAVGLPQLLKKLSSFSITLFDKEITPVPVVKDLGVLLDTRLSYNQHITEIASKCLFKLYQINRIKHLLDRKTLLLVINSFVFSKLQYCSTVWSNTSSSNIDKLQKVQNFAGRIILGLRKYDHISDGLRSLKWLPIREKLILNDATMMHKCINKLVPDYLADMFKSRSQVHNRQTRSSANHVRYRRSLYQFYQMISCATNNNPLKYNNYGCFCGLGGQGTPVDNLDRCCQKHDSCYRQINLDKRCRFPWYIYVKSYERKDCTGCDSVNDDCQSAICKCDSVAAQCFAKNKINPVYEKYPQRKCK
ncbi:uncharacterized protein [Porites lutea]|uniref:uncharacterized protein n=1 Tax=Porites lutea TaxID=51062 RepID=UPI003CC68AC5